MSGCHVIGPAHPSPLDHGLLVQLGALLPARSWWREAVWRLRHGRTQHGAAWCMTHGEALCVDYGRTQHGAAWCMTHGEALCVDYRGRLVHHRS